MINNVLLEIPPTSEAGILNLRLDRQIKINISAEEARRKVNRYVHMEISSQMHAKYPMLVVGDKAAWRVPVHLTFPSFGDVGGVGFMYVDPVTGKIDNPQLAVEKITSNAENLALRFASSTTN